MAEVVLPVDRFHLGSNLENTVGAVGSTMGHVAPEPNPPFVFPARRNLSATADACPPTFSNRPLSRVSPRALKTQRPNRISTNDLPAFDFRPSDPTKPVEATNTPPESPTPNSGISVRGGGHRRGGSEFIGGDGGASGLGLMSTSPTKREGPLPLPTSTAALGPPASGRGHAHRRSGAISSHDVSLIVNPSEPRLSLRTGSAPNTPSATEVHHSHEVAKDRPEEPHSPAGQPSPLPRTRRESAPASGQARARVEFSDTLEFIPRPLSIVSSEASSTMSPVQGSHSVSGSITSLVSGGTASPPMAKSGRPTFQNAFGRDFGRSRPKTAGAVMTGTVTGDPTANVRLPERPFSPSVSANTSTITQAGGLSEPSLEGVRASGDETSSMNLSPLSTPAVEPLDPLVQSTDTAFTDAPKTRRCKSTSCARPKTSPERRVPKKEKRVKSWGSILSRNGRHRTQKAKPLGRRTPTPPLRKYAPATVLDTMEINFDEDTTLVIHTPPARADPVPGVSAVQSTFANWKPRESIPSAGTEATSPAVIDLDAAMGPFNTPNLNPHFRDALDRGFTAGKRAMHSSGATGGFGGPGMHYHRRADSAPAMVDLQAGHFGLHHLASVSELPVFEEDEEEDEDASEASVTGMSLSNDGQEEVEGLGIGVQVVDADVMAINGAFSWSWQDDVDTHRGVKRKGSGLSDRERRRLVSAVSQGTSTGSLNSEVIVEESSDLEVVPINQEPRPSVVSKTSDDSTITPSFYSEPMIQRPASAPIDLISPSSDLQLATPRTFSSTFSSPGTESSFDMQRLATPSSSLTDRHTLNSLISGEPGPELRMSVDDVPSLTSSASTMTNAQPVGRFSSSAGTRSSAERSLSVSAADTTKVRNAGAGKRSSLASLSRLVGSSYGEKSKLFIEETAQPDTAAKPEKKKANRISRLFLFWRSKENLTSE